MERYPDGTVKTRIVTWSDGSKELYTYDMDGALLSRVTYDAAGNTTSREDHTPAPAPTPAPSETPTLTPEQLEALQRLFGQNAAYAAQQQTSQQQQQQPTPQPTPSPDELAARNTATPEQEARLQEFLTEHPHGSTWNEHNTYKNYMACAAFAMQAQQTIFGEDAAYVMSKDPKDIRQYSAVKEFVQGQGYHWYFVTSINDDGTITVSEGNVNGKVEQGNTFLLDPNTVELVWNPA